MSQPWHRSQKKLWLSLRQGLLFIPVYIKLPDRQHAKHSLSLSAFHGLQMCANTSDSMWVLELWLQALLLVWQALYPLRNLPSPLPNIYLWLTQYLCPVMTNT